ncbi:amino acid ABC transporter permease [Methylobacterium sp. ARG-1]|uniref:amino acid ABC transporter permease n=1 Tax=Methylobacterium sp. ARG-1 TaxID=1692501 RepID=UPI0006832F3E|nr:amino acid ABC transporter permease [Methylobacterium sp. ARG-1]KNY24483.1 polar amino acid ABC transporter permease [Methylobacterium sp. ARG-1]
MDDIVAQFFNIEVVAKAAPLLLQGLAMTAQLCAAVIGLGLVAGIAVAVASLSHNRLVRYATVFYVDVFRALPPLVLLVFIYSGLPFAGLALSPFQAVVIAFVLNNAAYYGEIYRAGLLSVPRGQREAGLATGLSPTQILVSVLLPQAVRNVLPDLISNTIEVVKLTSIASVVSLGELLYDANMARSLTYNASPLVAAALIYLMVLWPLVRLVSRYQRKLAI